eukprot:TRINITY_DN10602_c0_g1_i1.p1 TRINITY_DN10602_c0_g1~~TRINITY_DN10602_c0_g1_i1.p1  ORF type:complete len:243 (-),score=49.10 TRINITY_DN10602_c0_g1_i1:192-920(-)
MEGLVHEVFEEEAALRYATLVYPYLRLYATEAGQKPARLGMPLTTILLSQKELSITVNDLDLKFPHSILLASASFQWKLSFPTLKNLDSWFQALKPSNDMEVVSNTPDGDLGVLHGDAGSETRTAFAGLNLGIDEDSDEMEDDLDGEEVEALPETFSRNYNQSSKTTEMSNLLLSTSAPINISSNIRTWKPNPNGTTYSPVEDEGEFMEPHLRAAQTFQEYNLREGLQLFDVPSSRRKMFKK